MQQESSKKRKANSTAWFPAASIVKGFDYSKAEHVSIALFYQYISPLWSEGRKQQCISFCQTYCQEHRIGGRIRVGREGMNATISGLADDLRGFAEALGGFDEHFKKTDFKFLDNLPPDRAFGELKVFPVNEIVYYGIAPDEQLGPGGVHLEPEAYHEKLGQGNTVVIDVRNNYEAEIGRFQKQESVGGAEIIVPGMRKSTDFPAWLASDETKRRLAGKDVLMYCTGGVRCERASALLKREVGDSVNGVFQLQGGIEKYMKAFPEGGYWQGKNFVFDKREAVGVNNMNGVGGVVSGESKKQKKLKKKQQDSEVGEEEEVLGRCCFCDKKWDRYIGKKKCRMCGVPVLLCPDCCTKRVDKGEDGEEEGIARQRDLKMRCPLCVLENVTVPATEVEFTDNGVHIKQKISGEQGGGAARSVCKWGGGHAKTKKRSRQDNRAKQRLETVACKFGKECTRTDCWFSHE